MEKKENYIWRSEFFKKKELKKEKVKTYLKKEGKIFDDWNNLISIQEMDL